MSDVANIDEILADANGRRVSKVITPEAATMQAATCGLSELRDMAAEVSGVLDPIDDERAYFAFTHWATSHPQSIWLLVSHPHDGNLRSALVMDGRAASFVPGDMWTHLSDELRSDGELAIHDSWRGSFTTPVVAVADTVPEAAVRAVLAFLQLRDRNRRRKGG